DDRDVAALAGDTRLADRHDVIAARHRFFDATVQILVLEEQHAVVVADGGLHQALRVGGRRGIHHLEAGRVDETGFRILRVKGPAATTIPTSEIGVSMTRDSPNRSARPSVTLNAPPYFAMSSPRQNTAVSRSISSNSASRMASR